MPYIAIRPCKFDRVYFVGDLILDEVIANPVEQIEMKQIRELKEDEQKRTKPEKKSRPGRPRKQHTA